MYQKSRHMVTFIFGTKQNGKRSVWVHLVYIELIFLKWFLRVKNFFLLPWNLIKLHKSKILYVYFHLNKSWQQHPTRYQLYGHLPPITKTIHVRWTRHAGHCWRSRDELISDVLLWTPTYGQQKQDDQLEHTYSSYVKIQDVALRTCQSWWTIGRSGERGSGISVLAAWHDDDDDFHLMVISKISRRVHIALCPIG